MHLKFLRGMANAAVIGGIVTLGLGSAPAAMAQPVVDVTCSSSALAGAMATPADGATLELATGCTYVLTSGLPMVTNTLTIVGNGATLERSYHTDNSFSIITVAVLSDGNLTLDDVNFTNGAGGTGGAIDNGATLTVNGGTFLDNSAGTSGGAIFNDDTMTVNDAEFTGNSAQYGGAIYNDGPTMTVNDAEFTGNRASDDGGALYSKGDVWLNDTVLWQNGAEDGGAVFNNNWMRTSNTTIVQNDATRYGGGVANGECVTLIADGTTITDNAAGDHGGGIYDYGRNPVTLHDSVVLANVPDNWYPTGSEEGCYG
jgi:predicted outer membrane repeat protein